MTDIALSGTLTTADHKHHVAVPFDVPQGVTRLTGRFTTTPKRATGAFFDNMVCLTVFAPDGARGARHNNPDRGFSLTAVDATPGYVPGPVTPGRWQVVLDCFRLLGPEPVTWTLEIDFDTAPVAAPPPRPPRVVPAKGPGWYRGDLHAHTFHSDGTWTPEGLIGFARANRLDFASLTDHNTVSALPEFLALSDADLLTIGGAELTTHYGHFVAHGIREWQEWRAVSMPDVTMPAILAEIERKGGFGIIAHPRVHGDPECTGCRWEYADMMPGPARLVEIWNGPWSDYNEEGLALFRKWLDQGHKLRATSGTDSHRPDGLEKLNGFNTVHAEALTEAAVYAAIKAGRNVLSSGPMLTLSLAAAHGARADLGETLPTSPARADLTWTSDEPLELVLVTTGSERRVVGRAEGQGVTTIDLAPTAPGWAMAELRAGDGRLAAVTNPIWWDVPG